MNRMLLNFLKKTGKKKEFELFLNILKIIPKNKFAVIKISGQTIENHLDLISEDIAFLNKANIFPIIVHGAGSSLDRKLKDSKKINGYRITSESDMDVIKSTFNEIADQLKNKINSAGGSAEIVCNIFECEKIVELGQVGKITNVDEDKISKVILENKTPIISPLGWYENKYLNINADTAAKEVVKALGVKKFILLTETGGVLNENDEIISSINVSSEEDLAHITGGMLLKIKELKEFLEDERDCEIVITSAEYLLMEIFTIKGHGTFIKYFNINQTSDINSLDKNKIAEVLENSFNKKLVEDYFDDDFEEIYYQKDYEAVAIVKRVLGVPYLDKIGVIKPRQGTGMGKAIWERIVKKYPKLIWRATITNEVNSFYSKKCDGMIKRGTWYVYWIGLDEEEIFPAIEAVSKKEKTLLKVTG
ncbi:MAG: hypothetical protein JXA68_11350 [Ignavibacteriales bacterium]|nr:hypothetical protein [Ignavibacteriales bacterium]